MGEKFLETYLEFKDLVPDSLWEKTPNWERHYWFRMFRKFPIRIIKEGFKRNENWFDLAYHYCKWAWKVEQEEGTQNQKK